VAGSCLALFAYDVGFQIALSEAQRRLSDSTRQRVMRVRRPSPAWFEFEPAPLRLRIDADPLSIAGRVTHSSADCIMYDFGAVSVLYRIPFEGGLEDLARLSAALFDNHTFLEDSRRRVETLLEAIRPAVTKPAVADVVEDYLIFALERWEPGGAPDRFLDANREVMARILQSELAALSPQLIGHVLDTRMSYSPDDLAVIDWNAAVLFDRQPDDIIGVLQQANVELLEMRLLDRQLDELLDQSPALLARQSRRLLWPLDPGGRELRRFAQLQTDSALLFEGVNNAIKVLGEQYLARLYHLAARRLHLPQWDASVLRKLATADSIYQKMVNAGAARRMEVLEIIIILLIAISILLPLVTGLFQ
jgi:hypothetical protein